MKLISKLRAMITAEAEIADIIEDVYTCHSDAEMLEIFHSNLGMVAENRGMSYFEAFVLIVNSLDIDTSNRDELEIFLFGKGLCPIDIAQLLDAYYNIQVDL